MKLALVFSGAVRKIAFYGYSKESLAELTYLTSKIVFASSNVLQNAGTDA